MLGRIAAVTLTIGALMTSSAALAQRDPVAGAVAGAIEGAAIASGLVVPYEQREPLRTYVYREPRPAYRYEDEVAVGEVSLAATALLVEVLHHAALEIADGHVGLTAPPAALVVGFEHLGQVFR